MPDRDDLTQEIVEGLHGLFQEVERYSKRSLRECGLTGPQVWVLRLVREARTISVGELAARIFLHISTVSNLLSRLERKGLIARRRSDEDHRVVMLTVTPAGRRLVAGLPAPPRSRLPAGLQRLPDRELQEIRRAIGRIRKIMRVGGAF